MPDYPPEVIQRAAEVRMRQYESEYGLGPLTWRDFVPEVTAIFDAVAEQLGQHAAKAILRHSDEHEPEPGSRTYLAWHRHFSTAAQVAAQAFLTGDDLKAIAARELAAGNAVICFDGGSDEH